jgi:Rrf2 family protein
MSKVFNISEAASIAIHSLAIIAKSGKLINVDHIAEMTNFSKNHIAKVLQQLVKNNYIQSVRGPKGGFLPNKNTNKLSLLDIYEFIEGKLEVNKCNMHDGQCPFNHCVFNGLSERYTQEFRDYLKNTTVHEIIK